MNNRSVRGLAVVTAGAAMLAVASPPADALVAGSAGTVTLVSVSSTGRSANGDSGASGVSAHGRFVVVESAGSNLVPGDTNRAADVFLRDRLTGITTRVSVSSRGAQSNYHSTGGPLSADGRVVTFTSLATNLVAGDTNGSTDVFVRDRIRGVTERVSVATNGRQANELSEGPAISRDGRFVAFYSDASNLVAGDTNRSTDVFVRDRIRGVTERVSVATNGRQGNHGSSAPSISSNGRYVAFHSEASNLVAGDTNREADVFVRDRLKKVTMRVSVSASGQQFKTVGSLIPSISGNGRYVAFVQYDPEAVVKNGILVRDLVSRVTRRVPVPKPFVVPFFAVSLSENGRYVGYQDEDSSRMYIWDQWRNVNRRLPSLGGFPPLLSADGHHATFTTLPVGSQLYSSAYAWDDLTDPLVARTTGVSLQYEAGGTVQQ